MKEVEGFVIGETNYGETSKIINVLIENEGIIGVLCKGAKSMKSSLRSGTQLFTYGIFNIYYKKDKLSILVSVDIINPLKNILSDLTLISYLTYLADLTKQVIKQNSNNNIYELYKETVLKLNEGLDPLILTNIYEIKLLPYLGVGINLDECALCGSKTNIITIDGSRGGYICKKCYTNERIVNPKVIKLLRMYYYVDIKSISNFKIDNELKNEIDEFLNIYYDNYTGLFINSKKFLKDIIEIK